MEIFKNGVKAWERGAALKSGGFIMGLLNSAYLRSRARLAINKKQNYFSLPDYQLAENLILVFSFYERTKKR